MIFGYSVISMKVADILVQSNRAFDVFSFDTIIYTFGLKFIIMNYLLRIVPVLFSISNVFAQSKDFENAPLNPRPLEALQYIVPSVLHGDVAYYAGFYFDKDRNRVLEDGQSFKKFSEWTDNEARVAKSVYMKFNENGQILQYVDYGGSGSIRTYEYNSNGQLIKETFSYDAKTYTYDKLGRLEKEFRTFGSTDRTITILYSYKNEDGLLKVNKKSIYVEDDEVVEMHYKNGRLVYEKQEDDVEVCVPDQEGNCVSIKNQKSGSIKKVFYNVIYQDELKAENIVIKNIKKNNFSQNEPQAEIGGRYLKMPLQSFGNDVIAYFGVKNQYLIAKDFYDVSAVPMNAVVPVSILQENNPILAIWQNETLAYILYAGNKEGILRNSDENYEFYYNPVTKSYLYFKKDIKGVKGVVIPFKELNTEMLMYADLLKRHSTTLIEGKPQLSTYQWTSKKLNDQETVLLYQDEPKYIIPNIAAPEHLKIYVARNYNGEKFATE